MKKTGRDYIVVLLGNGIGRGIVFVNSLILARLLEPADFGKFSLFYIVMTLIWLFPDAFDTAFIRYAKITVCQKEKDNFLKAALLSKLVYSTIFLSIAYPFAYFLANYCFHKPEIQLLLMLAVICGVFLPFLMTLASIFQERERFVEFASLHTFYALPIFGVLVLFKLLKLGVSLNLVFSIHLAVSIVLGMVSVSILFRKIGKLFPLDFIVVRKFFSLSKWILGVIGIYYIFLRLDTLFLTRYLKFELIGIYSVAAQVTMIISLLTGSLSGVFLPKAAMALGSRQRLKTYLKEAAWGVFLINIFIIFLIIIAPAMVKVLYGEDYILAGLILRILLVGWIFAVIYPPFSFLFYTLDDGKTRFLLESFKFLLAIIFLPYFIRQYGIWGAAGTISVILFLNTVISLAVLKKKLASFLADDLTKDNKVKARLLDENSFGK